MLGGAGGETAGVIGIPAWAAYPWLRAGFSTRQGGGSAVYGAAGELNLGWTAEDVPEVVAANRAGFREAVGQGAALAMVTVQQVHGKQVRVVEEEPGPLMTVEGKATREADGLVCARPGTMVAVLTADCVPVLLADVRRRAVGALHAGWRGTLAGIVGEGVARMRAAYGSRAEDVVAAIGPCIGACCFAVGEEVRERFVAEDPEAATLFVREGEALRMDLVEANRRQLVAAGVPAEAVRVVGLCTACARVPGTGARQFFSHRAERGVTGRMLSGIAVVA